MLLTCINSNEQLAAHTHACNADTYLLVVLIAEHSPNFQTTWYELGLSDINQH